MILGVIPARGGSKCIPRKNIKLIADKSLLVWTIESARESNLLDRFVVTTEDLEIAEITKKYNAEVLWRPKKLASDNASTLSVLQHVLSKINADSIVILQPTSPIRDKGLIDRCIKKFIETGADSLATGFICKFVECGTSDKRRQDIKGFFYDDGNVYVIKSGLIKQGERFGKKVERMIIDKEQNIDIDDDFDFWLADQVLNKRVKEGKQ